MTDARSETETQRPVILMCTGLGCNHDWEPEITGSRECPRCGALGVMA